MSFEYTIATRETLLERLKGVEDHASWQDFFDTYWRLIYGFALKAGLTDDEARDVVQDTVATVARNIPEFQYDPAKCSFKTWLLNLTRWRIVDQLRKRKSSGFLNGAAGQNDVERPAIEEIAMPGGCDLERIWEDEWQANLLNAAAQRVKRQVKPRQYQMFYLHVLKELPVKEVAQRIGAGVGSVYLAKHRVGRLFKREIKFLQGGAAQ
jgi:RNA polymerase sigma-70 factor (ECF subfamily)